MKKQLKVDLWEWFLVGVVIRNTTWHQIGER